MLNLIAITLCVGGVTFALPEGKRPAPPTPLEKNSWALLVAGSKGYYNYRHQADICHSYHVMIAEGIPPERIIVMMYDDIAYSSENPTKGVIINKPNGTNVYAGVKIDYKGDDLNPQNFLNILSGNKKEMKSIGTGRVIESDSETNIFVYFADHGGTGILCFPDSSLAADELESTLKTMHKKKQYKKVIMYIEACESGSMFDNILDEDTDVFVMTAAAKDESSYGWYCDSGNCLGDEFSITWMEHMDKEKKGTFETFFHQFDKVRSKVGKSHVNIYGDYSIGPDALTPNKDEYTSSSVGIDDVTAVNSRDVPLYYYRHKLSLSNDVESLRIAQKQLDDLIRARKNADSLFEDLIAIPTVGNPHLRNKISSERLLLNKSVFPCYKELLRNFASQCFGYEHEYFIQHFYKLANICIAGLDTTELIKEMGSICAPYKVSIKTTVV